MEPAVETKKPLSERLGQLIANLKTKQEKPEIRSQTNSYQPFSQERCVICELPRLDGDPTGLTCGRPNCLSELGVRFNEMAENESTVEEFTENLTEIVSQLGFDPETLPKEPVGLLEVITGEISTIRSTLEEQTVTEEE